MADFIVSEGPVIMVPGDYKIIAVYCYDKDGNAMLLTGAVSAVLTVRATEDAATYLLRKLGCIESEGYQAEDGTIYPGIAAVEFMPEDTAASPAGEHWFDMEVRFLGGWFGWEVNRYKGALLFPYAYGRIRLAEVEGEVTTYTWLEVQQGRVALTDDAVNYIEVDDEGTVSANIVGFTEGSYPLYKVRTDSGVILYQWPGEDWFAEGTHSGLDFAYDAGDVLDPVTLALTPVIAGTVALTDDTVNYIEVDAAGVVSANDDCFTDGSHPLYRATTKDGEITTVVKSSQRDALIDSRGIYVRGDIIQTIAKDQFIFIAGITTPADTEEIAT